MNKPDRFDRVRMPQTCWSGARDALRTAGARSHECLLYLAGRFSGADGSIERVIVPAQQANAAHVQPDWQALDRISVELVQRGEILLMQLHSHPGEAFLSGTDRTYPASRKVGWFSAVAPNFGRDLGVDMRGVRVYEYRGDAGWRELDDTERDQRITMEV
jgi:proteasome lid subunit RPN8/RPN11